MRSLSLKDVVLKIDIQCFESTGVFPIGGSDHHITLCILGVSVCVDPQLHRFVVARNFQKLDNDKLDGLLNCNYIRDEVFFIVWNALLYDWTVGATSPT